MMVSDWCVANNRSAMPFLYLESKIVDAVLVNKKKKTLSLKAVLDKLLRGIGDIYNLEHVESMKTCVSILN